MGARAVPLIEDELQAAAAREADLLLYDYFKHMTTLALATLGGMLSIPQIGGLRLTFDKLLLPIGCIVAAGTLAVLALDGVITARGKGVALPRWVRWSRGLVTGLFGAAIGAFLGMLS